MEYCCMERMINIYRENGIQGRRCFICGNKFWYNLDGTKEWKEVIEVDRNKG